MQQSTNYKCVRFDMKFRHFKRQIRIYRHAAITDIHRVPNNLTIAKYEGQIWISANKLSNRKTYAIVQYVSPSASEMDIISSD